MGLLRRGFGKGLYCRVTKCGYFFSLGGFAFLPFLWLVNIFWFFREAFLAPAYTEQSQIKGCEFLDPREVCGRDKSAGLREANPSHSCSSL